MKKENDYMKHNIAFVVNGGDPKQLDNSEMKYLINSGQPDPADPFKTPEVVNIFD
jgi:hypothetical protein